MLNLKLDHPIYWAGLNKKSDSYTKLSRSNCKIQFAWPDLVACHATARALPCKVARTKIRDSSGDISSTHWYFVHLPTFTDELWQGTMASEILIVNFWCQLENPSKNQCNWTTAPPPSTLQINTKTPGRAWGRRIPRCDVGLTLRVKEILAGFIGSQKVVATLLLLWWVTTNQTGGTYLVLDTLQGIRVFRVERHHFSTQHPC